MNTVERLTSMDAVWLQIDSDTHPMQLIQLVVTATPIRRDQLEKRLQTGLSGLQRFSQRVLHDTAGTVWESGPVDVAAHLTSVALPPGKPKETLARLVSTLATQALDPDRPLWQFHLVERYLDGSAVIARVHQSLADTIALTGILRALADPEPAAASPVGENMQSGLFDQFYAPLTAAVIDSIKLTSAFWAKYWSLLFNPQRVFDYACASTALALEIGKLSALPDDSRSPFKGPETGVRQASWSEPIDLSRVEAIARSHDSTSDAVILSALAGAIHPHREAKMGSQPPELALRILMPVNLRDEDSEDPLGNRCGLIPLELPIGIPSPEDRLRETDRRIRSFMNTYEAQRAVGLFSLLGQTPRAVRLQSLNLLARKSSALLYRVPGTPEARSLCGARIIEEIIWSPPPAGLGVTISIVSLEKTCHVGVLADTGALSTPEEITRRLAGELTLLAPTPAVPPTRNRARRGSRKA